LEIAGAISCRPTGKQRFDFAKKRIVDLRM